MEQYIERRREIILSQLNNLIDDDDAVIEYMKQTVFTFLPGHYSILLDLPNSIREMQSQSDNSAKTNMNDCFSVLSRELSTDYSIVLREFVNAAKNNKDKSKNVFQCNDIVKYFATYVFLLCGRTCYETLNKNLPIPSTNTICEFNHSVVGI